MTIAQTGKNHIRSQRDLRLSRHNGGPIEGPRQTPQYTSALMHAGFQGGHQLFPHDAGRRQPLGQLIAVVFSGWTKAFVGARKLNSLQKRSELLEKKNRFLLDFLTTGFLFHVKKKLCTYTLLIVFESFFNSISWFSKLLFSYRRVSNFLVHISIA